MASFFLDADVSLDVADLLRSHDHEATTAQSLHLEHAGDDLHLLTSARRGWILVTHNRKDYVLLHDAWRHWSSEWFGVAAAPPRHAGILVVPQGTPARIANELASVVHSNQSLSNELYRLRTDGHWERQP